MNLKSELLYNTMCFLLTKYPNLTHNELIEKLKKFENVHLENYRYSPFLLPTLVELKDLLDGKLNPEFMEITIHFKLSKDSIKPMFEPDINVFSINQMELLKDL